MQNLKNNVFQFETLTELENDLETNCFNNHEGYLFGDYGTTKLSDIIEEVAFQGIELDRLIELTQNGYGGSVWTLYHIKDEGIYLLFNNQI